MEVEVLRERLLILFLFKTKSSLDENLKEKLNECKLEFVKYEKKGDEIIETTDTILLK